jgi:hypothetical protein
MSHESQELEGEKIHAARSREGQERKIEYSLCGLAVTETGKVVTSKLFSFLKLDPEEYGHLVLTAEEAQRVHKRLIAVKLAGASAKVPLICGGPEICPFADQCAFVEIKKIPVACVCPIEKEFLAFWVDRYIAEFGVDIDNQSEVSLVSELAELELYDMRASMILNKPENADMMQEICVGVNAEGNAIVNRDINKAWDLKERIKRRKEKILVSMVGTRREKYKRDAALKRRSTADPSKSCADLKKKLDAMRADRAKPVEKPGDAIVDMEERSRDA